jgi:hypothetical protein
MFFIFFLFEDYVLMRDTKQYRLTNRDVIWYNNYVKEKFRLKVELTEPKYFILCIVPVDHNGRAV